MAKKKKEATGLLVSVAPVTIEKREKKNRGSLLDSARQQYARGSKVVSKIIKGASKSGRVQPKGESLYGKKLTEELYENVVEGTGSDLPKGAMGHNRLKEEFNENIINPEGRFTDAFQARVGSSDTKTLRDAARELNINPNTVINRINSYSQEIDITPPITEHDENNLIRIAITDLELANRDLKTGGISIEQWEDELAIIRSGDRSANEWKEYHLYSEEADELGKSGDLGYRDIYWGDEDVEFSKGGLLDSDRQRYQEGDEVKKTATVHVEDLGYTGPVEEIAVRAKKGDEVDLTEGKIKESIISDFEEMILREELEKYLTAFQEQKEKGSEKSTLYLHIPDQQTLNEMVESYKTGEGINYTRPAGDIPNSKKRIQASIPSSRFDKILQEEISWREVKAGGGLLSTDRQQYQEAGPVMPLPQETAPLPQETASLLGEPEGIPVEEDVVPDEQMEDSYLDYVISQSLNEEEENYLMDALEADPQLSMIFDKVMDTATEFAGSGPVEGPGSEVSDSIPARLSDGEFVITAKATDEIGPDNLQSMMDEAEVRADQRQTAQEGGLIRPDLEEETDELGRPINQEIRKGMLGVNPRLQATG